MRTRLLWALMTIILAWSCSSAGAYRLLDSLDEPSESCPAGRLSAQHKTYYKVGKLNEAHDKQTCGISDQRHKPLRLLLRIFSIRRLEPQNVIPGHHVERRAGLFRDPRHIEKPRRKLILILNEKPHDMHPGNARFM
ncbi:hypothetical protein AWZ03_009413 [Drosophila navojoa]|uniref:Uncharacterized protein n=1 Tax=Drosophila navojoa TaxID=7232 RepID=A0A484B5Z2_DRONA|nr:hypothetical protein AWZ03_009413 [Drosophila navojoa]